MKYNEEQIKAVKEGKEFKLNAKQITLMITIAILPIFILLVLVMSSKSFISFLLDNDAVYLTVLGFCMFVWPILYCVLTVSFLKKKAHKIAYSDNYQQYIESKKEARKSSFSAAKPIIIFYIIIIAIAYFGYFMFWGGLDDLGTFTVGVIVLIILSLLGFGSGTTYDSESFHVPDETDNAVHYNTDIATGRTISELQKINKNLGGEVTVDDWGDGTETTLAHKEINSQLKQINKKLNERNK